MTAAHAEKPPQHAGCQIARLPPQVLLSLPQLPGLPAAPGVHARPRLVVGQLQVTRSQRSAMLEAYIFSAVGGTGHDVP